MIPISPDRVVEEFLRVVPNARTVLDDLAASDPESYGAWLEGRVDDMLEFFLQAFTRPVLLPLLREDSPSPMDEAAIRACFEYVEGLVLGDDSYLESSLYFGIVEQFMEGKEMIRRAYFYSLPATRAEVVSLIERYPETFRSLRAELEL
ncbi:hypothetical protein [Streptomyces sp. NPDC050287]|uniref:hypothetical protein n=1 Tax=Streptomyces sp. NPDC050287 TaxID=3365608 RepID=UPI0037BA7F85